MKPDDPTCTASFHRKSLGLPWYLAAAAAIAILIAVPNWQTILWMVMGRPAVRIAGPRTECKNNLRQIGLALHNYHESFGCFPPAFVADPHGRPLYSWRVLILPGLEQQNLYNEFKLDEPWDSPHNIKLSRIDLAAFRCASSMRKGGEGLTDYVAITGRGTAFEGTKSHVLKDFKDGMSNTVLIVEVGDSDFHWAEPRDLDIDAMNLTINADRRGFSSNHKGGAQALLGDGSVRMLKDELPSDTVRAAFTINGGEPDPSF